MKLNKSLIHLLMPLISLASTLFVPANSHAVAGLLSGSCGMIVNISTWGVPINYGGKGESSSNLLMLINFDSGKISGYSTNVTFGAKSTDSPTYSTYEGGVDFDVNYAYKSDGTINNGFYRLTPRDLNKMPELAVLPVNGGNTFLVIAADNPGATAMTRTPRGGSGGSGVCQKL
ncbi:MAG: hypothetical protein WCO72_13295 [Betaproteobacteria bacterium]